MDTPIALRTTLRHVSRSTGTQIEVIGLRRWDVKLRRSDYRGLVVDERVLTGVFPWAPPKLPRLQVLVVLGGRVGWDGLAVGPNEVVLLRPEQQAGARFEDCAFMELEWVVTEGERDAVRRPSRLGSLEPDPVAALEAAILSPARDQREAFHLAFETLRGVGAPLGDRTAATLLGFPTERDARISRAIEAQLASLGTKADAANLGDLASLSPRQLQRALTEHLTRYEMNAGVNWRDMRNRWRLQIAAVLLSVERVSVAEIAVEVGYGSAPALARAFAMAGFPPPTEVRRLLNGAREP